MAINYVISYTFTPGTTISSSQVNTNFSDNANTWVGLEALTKSFAALRVDATPTTTTDVVIKSYVDKLNAYRRPLLQYSSGTVVNLETGINGTSGQAQILFPDGTLRTDSTSSRINLTVSQTAAFSGSAQSGMDTGSVANNSWLSVYAAKVTDSTTNFITVASLLTPIQANFATLNSRLGTNGWVYLGVVPYGDGAGTVNAIVKFSMSGNGMVFRNSTSGNALSMSGPRLATTTASTSAITWSYAAGTAIGSQQIPNQVAIGLLGFATGAANGDPIDLTDSAVAYNFGQFVGSTVAVAHRLVIPLVDGAKLTNTNASSSTKDIFLLGFWDSSLGIGANPLL